jgi:hypothetical protein
LATHFTEIGIPVDVASGPEGDLNYWANRAWDAETQIDLGAGTIRRWQMGNGAELWVQVDRAGENVLEVDPHFSGTSRVGVELDARFQPWPEEPLCGGFTATVDPERDGVTFPLAFSVPDFGLYSSLALPSTCLVQLAVFAHSINAFKDEDTYLAQLGSQDQAGDDPIRGFASQSFVPTGLFRPGASTAKDIEPLAMLTGHVISASRLVNPATGSGFWALGVETLSMTVDVVADLGAVPDVIGDGWVVQVNGWLSARILEE